MGVNGKGGILLFLMWAGFGFLGGLTGSVAAAPRYFPETAQTAALVYNTGLKPAGQSSPAAGAQPASAGSSGQNEAEVFITRGCIQCHKILAYNLKGGETGPDLSIAYNDVPARYGKTLKEFLWKPEGTMGEVLPGREVTDEEKNKILELLTKAAEKGKNQSPSVQPQGEKAKK